MVKCLFPKCLGMFLKISIKLMIFQFWVFIFISCLYALQTSYPAGHPPLSLRMPFFILIDFLPSVILEHSETTTRFFFLKILDVLQNRSSTGENLLLRNFVDVYITRDSQRLPTLERVSTGYGWYEMVGSFDIWLIAIGDVCNTVALTRLPADRSRGGSERGRDVVQGGRVAWGQRRWKRWTICICHKVVLKLITSKVHFRWSFHINIRQATLAHLKLTSLPSRKESRSCRVCDSLSNSKTSNLLYVTVPWARNQRD